MSTTPSDYARWLSEPSIVIDPSLLADMAPRCPTLGRRVARVTFATLRTVACAGILGVTLFSVAHADKWLARGHNSAHASEKTHLLAEAQAPAAIVIQAAAQEAEGPAVQALAPYEVRDAQVTALAPSGKPPALPLVAAVVPTDDAMPAQPVAQPEQTIAVALTSQTALEAQAAEEALRDALRDGRRALAQSRLDDSEAAYGSVLARRPHHPGAIAGLARVGLARGDLDGAYKLALQAVHYAPAHAVYHVTLADVLRARGETAGADLEYETAARLSRKPLDRAAKILPENPF